MKLKTWHALVLILIVILAAYYPALLSPLNSVDDLRMVNELLNHGSFSWHDFIFPTSKSFYRPLVNSTFILDQLLWNMETPFLHLENLLLHCANALLVFAVMKHPARLYHLSETKIPLIAALVFGLHPINTEAVIWIAGRADLMAGFFILLTLLCSFNYYQSGSRYWALGIPLALFAGCLAKETTLLIWPGLLLLGYFSQRIPRDRSVWQSVTQSSAYFPAFSCLLGVAGYFGMRLMALQKVDLGMKQVATVVGATTGAVNTLKSVSANTPVASHKLEHAITVSGFYLRKMFQPFPLNFGIIEVPGVYFWLGLLLIFLCLYLISRPSWSGWFYLSAVSLGSIALLVSFGGISWTPIAERYMYAPSAMTSAGLVLTGTRLLQGGKSILPTVLLAIFLIGATVSIFQRAQVWQDNVTLFEDTLTKSPQFKMARYELAMALASRGDKQQSVELLRDLDLPDFQVASLNKASVWINQGEYAQARNYLVKRLDNPGAYRRIILERLVKVLQIMIDHAETSAEKSALQDEALGYLDGLWTMTQEPFYLYRLGRMHMMMGNTEAARLAFVEAYKLFPEGSMYKTPAGKLAESLRSP